MGKKKNNKSKNKYKDKDKSKSRSKNKTPKKKAKETSLMEKLKNKDYKSIDKARLFKLAILFMTLVFLIFILLGQIKKATIITKEDFESIVVQEDKNLYDNGKLFSEEEAKDITSSIKKARNNKLDLYVITTPSILTRSIEDYTKEVLKTYKKKEDTLGVGVVVYVTGKASLRIQFDETLSSVYRNDKINEVLKRHSKDLENNVSRGLTLTIEDLADLVNLESYFEETK